MSFWKKVFGGKTSTNSHPPLVIQFPLHVPIGNRIPYDEAKFLDLFTQGQRPLSLSIEVDRVRTFIAGCMKGAGPFMQVAQSIERKRLLSLFAGMRIYCGKCGQDYLTDEKMPVLLDQASLPRCSKCRGTTAVLLFDEIGEADLLPTDADAVLSYMHGIAEGWWSSGVPLKVKCATCEKPILAGSGFYYPPCREDLLMDCAQCGEELRSELVRNPLKFGEHELRIARYYFGNAEATSQLRAQVAKYVQGLRT